MTDREEAILLVYELVAEVKRLRKELAKHGEGKCEPVTVPGCDELGHDYEACTDCTGPEPAAETHEFVECPGTRGKKCDLPDGKVTACHRPGCDQPRSAACHQQGPGPA